MGHKYLLVALLFASTLSLAAEDVKIVAIRATGSREFSEAEIALASGLTINQVIAPAEFKNAADRLASTGAFAQVGYKYGPLGPGMFVEFQVEDAPEFLPVRFENFVWMNDADLSAELAKRVALFHGHLPPGGALVDQTVAALQSMITERGVNARALARLHSPAPGRPIDAVSIYLTGLPLVIKSIEVTDAQVVPPSETNAAVKTLIGMNYDRGVIEDSIRYKLEPVYRSKGLLRAQIDPPQVAISGDPKNPDVALTIHVSEGLQYKFGRLQWTGNTVVTEKELSKTIAKCTTGEPANLLLLMQGAEFANGMYKNKGYLESKVQLIPSFDDANKTVEYELHVVEGRQFRMGRFEVTGLDAKLCEQLQNAWKVKPGDPYDPSYEVQFVRDHIGLLRGRPARTVVSQKQDATVDIRIEF